ncbi:hypothetical protein SAMN04487910_0664 [Aquimarina amphilecti]|uniref:Uncharacterized protein n=1 Tax=Aquimarina amphilecti TaxID=1038014 RepID=A0A1H7HLP5_AQUAM|nr:hypothetical protein SAMN04487910_0664 [Aquimarina amphilecti]
MKKSTNKKNIIGLSAATILLLIAILVFLKKVHIGVYYAY